jgi:hypothetical protein
MFDACGRHHHVEAIQPEEVRQGEQTHTVAFAADAVPNSGKESRPDVYSGHDGAKLLHTGREKTQPGAYIQNLLAPQSFFAQERINQNLDAASRVINRKTFGELFSQPFMSMFAWVWLSHLSTLSNRLF